MLIFTLFFDLTGAGGDLAEWGTLAGLKVYEICVRKNIIVSVISLLHCHAFGCENGMFVCLSDGESSDDDFSDSASNKVITMFGDVILLCKTR